MNRKFIFTLTGLLAIGATSLIANSNVDVQNVEQKGHYHNNGNINNSNITTSVNIKNSRATVRDIRSHSDIDRSNITSSNIGTSLNIKNSQRAIIQNVMSDTHIDYSNIHRSKIGTAINVKNSRATIKNIKTVARIKNTNMRNTTIGARVDVK